MSKIVHRPIPIASVYIYYIAGYFSSVGMPIFINPWHACAARVTVVWSVSLSFCVCVCLFNISPLERLFVLKTISHTCTQWATKVKIFVGFSFHCRDSALSALYGYLSSAIFLLCKSATTTKFTKLLTVGHMCM